MKIPNRKKNDREAFFTGEKRRFPDKRKRKSNWRQLLTIHADGTKWVGNNCFE